MGKDNQKIIMYSTSWCGDCVRSKRFLDEQGIDYNEVNIDEVPGAAEKVMELNGGNRSVPTIIFPDGGVLVEPTNSELTDNLSRGVQL